MRMYRRALLAVSATALALSALAVPSAQASTGYVYVPAPTRVTTAGTALVVRGNVRAVSPHRPVSVQIWTGTTWRTLVAGATTTTGAFAVRYTAPVGRVTTRVRAAAAGSAPAVVSPGWVVTGYRVGTYAAPTSVTWVRATCVRVSAYAYRVTGLYTARGGLYVDLGNPTHRLAVPNYGATRTWESTPTLITAWGGGPLTTPPTSYVAALAHQVSPLGQAAVPSTWKNFGPAFGTFGTPEPVTCPA